MKSNEICEEIFLHSGSYFVVEAMLAVIVSAERRNRGEVYAGMGRKVLREGRRQRRGENRRQKGTIKRYNQKETGKESAAGRDCRDIRGAGRGNSRIDSRDRKGKRKCEKVTLCWISLLEKWCWQLWSAPTIKKSISNYSIILLF